MVVSKTFCGVLAVCVCVCVNNVIRVRTLAFTSTYAPLTSTLLLPKSMPVSPALAFSLANGGTSASSLPHARTPYSVEVFGGEFNMSSTKTTADATTFSLPRVVGNFASCLTLPREQTLQIFCTDEYRTGKGKVNEEAEVAVRPCPTRHGKTRDHPFSCVRYLRPVRRSMRVPFFGFPD